jgi:RNA polymerase sigma-70 factor (ECF subfamily)
MRDDSDFRQERQRIFTLCCRWTGDALSAEDITQEVFLVGLRRQAQGKPPTEWRAFLTGVAKRLCANWRKRQQAQERYRANELPDVAIQHDAALASPDPLDYLLQSERESLIETALGRIKAPMRALLVSRYVDDLPIAEIATQWGVSENAAMVRLHRGREALRRHLETDLRDLANAHGLLDSETAEGWRETPIYCCLCGNTRLVGRFIPVSGQDTPDFALRCPRCSVMLAGQTNRPKTFAEDGDLAGVKGFRAGLNRVNRWWQGYLHDALTTGETSCPDCGKTAHAQRHSPSGIGGSAGLYIVCAFCSRLTFYIAPSGLFYHSDELQAFWRMYPRMRHTRQQSIIFAGRPATHSVFSDPHSSAELEAIHDNETLACLKIGS